MYERLVWKLPKSCQGAVKALAGWILRGLAVSSMLSPSIKHGLARALSFRYRAVAEGLRTMEKQPPAKIVLFLSLQPHTREVKFAEEIGRAHV